MTEPNWLEVIRVAARLRHAKTACYPPERWMERVARDARRRRESLENKIEFVKASLARYERENGHA